MTGRERYDVIVAGLGAWGSAAIAHLARRGRRVLGLDARRPPHRHGSHHGDGRVIRMASPESPVYAPLMVRAYELWRELEHDTGLSLLTTCGAISAGPDGDPIVEGALSSYRAAGVPHEVLDREQARERFPWLTLALGERVVFEPSGGVLRPAPAIAAQLARAADGGATLLMDEPILDWSAGDGGVRVATPNGEHRADHLILVVGVAAEHLLRSALPLEVERQVVAVYESPAHGMAAVAVPSAHGECFYGLPEGPGRYKVGIHHGGRLDQGSEHFEAAVTDEDLALIDRYVRDRLPGLPARPVESYTCRYTDTPDLNFVVGPHPTAERVVIASGDSGHGFKLAPVVGELLADFVEGRPTADVTAFDPLRFAQAPR